MSRPENRYWNMGDMTYHSETNSEALADLNRAIDALYSLEVGAFSANTRNTPTDIEQAVKRLEIKCGEWADKLSQMRSLIFGYDINWIAMQQELASIPDMSNMGKKENGDD